MVNNFVGNINELADPSLIEFVPEDPSDGGLVSAAAEVVRMYALTPRERRAVVQDITTMALVQIESGRLDLN